MSMQQILLPIEPSNDVAMVDVSKITIPAQHSAPSSDRVEPRPQPSNQRGNQCGSQAGNQCGNQSQIQANLQPAPQPQNDPRGQSFPVEPRVYPSPVFTPPADTPPPNTQADPSPPAPDAEQSDFRDDTMSCVEAAHIISVMRGGMDYDNARAELGCPKDDSICRIKNSTILALT